MGIIVPPCCVLCNEADETRDHLFFCCRISRAISGKVLDFLKVGRVPTRWHLLIPWFKSINQCRLKTIMISAAVTSTMVALLKARNSIIFRSESLTEENITRTIIWELKVKLASIDSTYFRLDDRDWLSSMGFIE
ncbi:hypothetical protein QQ045_010453 [Rhodiola kirilowii]